MRKLFLGLIVMLFPLSAWADSHWGGKTLCLVHNLYQEAIPSSERTGYDAEKIDALFAAVQPACVEANQTYTRAFDKEIHSAAYFDKSNERIDALIALEEFVPENKRVNAAFMKIDDRAYHEWGPSLLNLLVSYEKEFILEDATNDPDKNALQDMYGDNNLIVRAYHNAIPGYINAMTAITARTDLMDGVNDPLLVGLYQEMNDTYTRLRPQMNADTLSDREHPLHYEIVHNFMGLSIQFMERLASLGYGEGDESYLPIYAFMRSHVMEGIELGPEGVCAPDVSALAS